MGKSTTEEEIVLNTTKFGQVKVNKESIFNFVAPIIGFSDYKTFTIVDYKPESPFKWLQSTEDMSLSFPITLCSFFGIDYEFSIPDEEEKMLGIENADDVFACNIANIPSSDPKLATINMLAPIVINLSNKKAMQLVLKDTNFEVHYKLFDREDTEK